LTTDYLPEWATLAEASQWLEKRTGEPWPLPRLIEAGATPHIWFTPDAAPDAAVLAQVFDGRHEGFIAPLVFAGDTQRLAIDRSGAMSMTRSPSGKLVRFVPGIPFAIDELRFKADHVRRSIATAEPAPEADDSTHIEPVARWQAQEQTILSKLRELGYSPRALPKGEAWKPGVKAEVRAAIGSKGMWHSPKVFDKAWERLRERGEVADKP
jgi:hypothetical protein